jgi:serralysin
LKSMVIRFSVLLAILLMSAAQASGLSRPIEATGDPRLDGILSNITWRSRNLTFAFPDLPFRKQPPGIDFEPLSDIQRGIERAVFKELEQFTLLKFEEISDADQADLTFSRWQNESRLGRVDGRLPDGMGGWVERPGQTWLSDLDAAFTNQSLEGDAFHFWRHETGHILGLEHPHNNYTRVSAPIELDNISNTVMSYRIAKKQPPARQKNFVYSTTYMPLDILSLQYLHGANFLTNAADTIYKFVPDQSALFETIWDGGGRDTLDFSAYQTDGRFDIRPGEFSTPSRSQLATFTGGAHAEGSIALALLPSGDTRALIEDIAVGSGDNTITLNQANNNVRLGSGKNRVVVFPRTGADTIEGFDADDCVDLTNYFIEDRMVHITAGLIKIDEWPGDSITIASDGMPQICSGAEEPLPPEKIIDASHMAASEIAKLRAEMSGASSKSLLKSYENLWKIDEYEAAFALASLAFEKYQAKAAAYRIGTALMTGLGAEKDIERAFEYFSFPALMDARYARYFRGVILADPSFSKYDIEAAKAEFEAAGEMGVPDAAAALAALKGRKTAETSPARQ